MNRQGRAFGVRGLVNWKLVPLMLGLAALVFMGLILYGSFGELSDQLARFPLPLLPLVLALSSLNYLLRYIRWRYYLRQTDVQVDEGQSIWVFLSGLSMSATPAKAGELLKSYLLKQGADIPISHTVPVVVMERITDVMSVLLLLLVGVLAFGYGWPILVVGSVAIVAGAYGLGSRRGMELLLKAPLVRKFREPLRESQERFHRLLAPKNLAIALVLGAVSWFGEAAGFWVVLLGLNVSVSLLEATFIYSFAMLAGAATLLPGGLGAAEVSMIGLLALLKVTGAAASAATLIIRVCTLWFAVFLGVVALFICTRRMGQPGPKG